MTKAERRKERAAYMSAMQNPKFRAKIFEALEEDAREARETLQKLQQQPNPSADQQAKL